MENTRTSGRTAADNAAVAPGSACGLGAVAVLALGTFVVGTDAFIVSAFLPGMAKDLAVTTAMAAHSVTAFALAYACLAPVISAFTAAIERRRLLVLALLSLGLANIGSALAPSLDLLIVARIMAAAAAAAYTPNAGAVAATMVRPEIRARALAVVIGGLTAATALGIPLGHVVSAVLNWRAALVLVGVLSALAALGISSIMPDRPGGARMAVRNRLAVLRHRKVLVILPLTVTGMAAGYVPYAFTLPVLDALTGPSGSATAMLFCYGLGAVAGNYLSGWATDRAGPISVLACAYALMSWALGAMAFASGDPPVSRIVVAGFMICWGASSWAQTPAQQHRLISRAPQEASLVVGLNSSAIYLGIAIGTAIGGAVMPAGVAQTLWYGSALAGIALCYALAVR